MRKSGLAKYLKDGIKKESEFSRLQKDTVLSLYGNLESLEQAEEYCLKYKEWEKNYEHIVVAFSKEDMNILYKLEGKAYKEKLKEIALTYIKHRTSGYDLENEVIAYAEAHLPKLKEEADYKTGEIKERLAHIHIGISYLNPLSDTKLRTTFFNNAYISDTLDKYVALKNNLTFPIAERSDNQKFIKTEWSKLRSQLIKDIKDIYTEEDLIKYFEVNDIVFEKRKNKYTVTPVSTAGNKLRKINIRGKDFPTVEAFLNNGKNTHFTEELKSKRLEELEQILLSYYQDRSELIDSRRSEETKALLEQIHKNGVVKADNKEVKSFIDKAIRARDKDAQNETTIDKILEDLKNNNVFLTGGAGVGKSYVTIQIIKEYEKKHSKVAKLGSTGIASQNIGGTTLHDFFNIGIAPNLETLKSQDKNKDLSQTLQKISETDLIVLDEVSMISNHQMEMIEYRLKQANYKGKILLVGDFQQLPPVKGGYAFQSEQWNNLNIKTHQLNTIRRSDNKEFSELLNRARYGKINTADDKFLKSCEDKSINDLEYTFIFSTNKKADAHNKRMIEKLAGSSKAKEYKTDLDLKFEDNIKLNRYEKEQILKGSPFDTKLTLAKNTPVLITINDKERGLANGQRGIFKGTTLTGEAIIELEDKTKVTLKKHIFQHKAQANGKDINVNITQYPIRPAFGITVHKSQGMSIENLAIDPNSYFAANQFYVAISRSANPSKLKILPRNANIKNYQQIMKIDETVLKFYHPSLKTAEDKEKVITTTYQQKLFYQQYGHLLKDKLNGYFIDVKQNQKVTFENRKKDIKIEDRGDKVVSKKETSNLQEEVNLMLDIAEAKGWDLSNLDIKGNEEFKEAVNKEIKERLVQKQGDRFIQELGKVKAIDILPEKVPVRANSPLQEQKIEATNKRLTKSEHLLEIKENLKAKEVLNYAIAKYKINPNDYEIVDNKINILRNKKEKPKNVIDFLQKEVGLQAGEAITELENLYKNENMRVNSTNQNAQKTKIQGAENAKQKRYYSGNIYKSDSRNEYEDIREAKNINDMSKLSDKRMVYNKSRPSDKVLLSENAQPHNRPRHEQRGNDKRVQSADNRTPKNAQRAGRELKMAITLSICKDTYKDKEGGLLALKKWEQVEVKTYSELVNYMKKYPYSMVNYGDKLSQKGSQRHNHNITNFQNFLVYDIDNDPKQPKLSITEAEALLKKHDISALIIPSKSHQIEKFTKSGKSKGIEDRYRVIIPTNRSLKSNNIEVYKEFQELATKALKIDKNIDLGISQNPSTFYYPSPETAQPIVIKSKNVMQIDKLEAKAIQNIEAEKARARAEAEHQKQLQANINKYKKAAAPAESQKEYLTYADTEKIMKTDISYLINLFEKCKAYKEGSYEMFKTQSAKYSILKNQNTAHDFKNNQTYNPITYLEKQLNTNTINDIARELERRTGDKYITTNIEAVQEAVNAAKALSTNDKTFEENIKKYFNVKKCQIDFKKESLIIADRELKFNQIDISKEQLIKQFQENRKLQKNNQKEGLKL